jgi:hypothetical protein
MYYNYNQRINKNVLPNSLLTIFIEQLYRDELKKELLPLSFHNIIKHKFKKY